MIATLRFCVLETAGAGCVNFRPDLSFEHTFRTTKSGQPSPRIASCSRWVVRSALSGCPPGLALGGERETFQGDCIGTTQALCREPRAARAHATQRRHGSATGAQEARPFPPPPRVAARAPQCQPPAAERGKSFSRLVGSLRHLMQAARTWWRRRPGGLPQAGECVLTVVGSADPHFREPNIGLGPTAQLRRAGPAMIRNLLILVILAHHGWFPPNQAKFVILWRIRRF